MDFDEVQLDVRDTERDRNVDTNLFLLFDVDRERLERDDDLDDLDDLERRFLDLEYDRARECERLLERLRDRLLRERDLYFWMSKINYIKL